MNGLEILLAGPIAQAVGWALVHLLWQGVLVALLLAAVLELMKSASASQRYIASCLALTLLVILPVATAVRVFEPPTFTEQFTITPATAHVSSLAAVDAALTTAAPRTLAERLHVIATKARGYFPQIIIAWLAGVLLLSIRLGLGWLYASRLAHRQSRPATRQWESTLRSLSTSMGLRRAVRILESAAVEVPTVIGWLRPVILLPISTLAGLSIEQIQMILAHELAHIRRHDFFVNLVQAIVETVLFYHPAVWWISRQVRIEREHCCDDMAIQVCGNPLQYARALTRLEELRVDAAHAVIAANGGSLMMRIKRLVVTRTDSATPSRWLAGAALVAGFAVLVGLPALPLLAGHSEAPKPAVESTHIHSDSIVNVTPSDEPAAAVAVENDDDNAPDVDDPEDTADVTPETPEVPLTPPLPMNASLYETPMLAPMPPVAVPSAMPAVAPVAAPAVPAPPYPAPHVRPMVRVNVAPAVRGGSHSRSRTRIGSGEKLTVDDLITLRTYGIDGNYIAQMKGTGIGDLTLGDVVDLRNQGVTPEYLTEMRGYGLEIKDVASVISLRSLGISSAWIAGMKRAGVDRFSINDLLELRGSGVNGEFVSAMAAAGYPNLSSGELIELRATGVTPAYVHEMSAAGYKSLSTRELSELRAVGVTTPFVKSLADAGYKHLSEKELIRLATSGVNADFIREMSVYRDKK